jgi:hypothetical protein
MADSGEEGMIYGYDIWFGEENKYPLELLNEDIERMLNSDDELNDALNALNEEKADELNDALNEEKAYEYGYDTEDNNYSLELLNEDIDRMLDSDEFNDALNALKSAMEKEYFENDLAYFENEGED